MVLAIGIGWPVRSVAAEVGAVILAQSGPSVASHGEAISLQGGTRVVVSPASVQINPGQMTTVDIRIEDVPSLFAAEVNIRFDPTVLQVDGTQIQQGPFLGGVAAVNVVNNSEGTIQYVETLLGQGVSVSGSGTIARITFQGLSNGISTIHFDRAILLDPQASEIPITVEDGSITVGTPAPTSTPTRTPSPTPTATVLPPTATATMTLPPTATPTATTVPPTMTPTGTSVSSTATPTGTSVVPPTATPTATSTQPPPTATPTATATAVLPTATFTATPVLPTATSTPQPYPYPWPPTPTPVVTLPPTGVKHAYVSIVVKNWHLTGEKPTATPTATSTPTPTPTISPCQELVGNGGFELTSDWWMGNTPRPARYTTERAHSGIRSMLLGIKPPDTDVFSYSSLWQPITLPSTGSSAMLSFWYWPATEDTIQYDAQQAMIFNPVWRRLATVLNVAEDTQQWTFKSYDLTPYLGSDINLYFNVLNDGVGNLSTYMYVDDVSILVCE